MPETAATPFVIRHLLDVPDALPLLARWFVSEWEPYYGADGPGDAETDLCAARDRNRLPLCLVAVSDADRPLGTIALKAESVASHRHLGPWLAAFLVAPAHRGQGVGTALIAALEDEARRLGFTRIYTATDTAVAMIERRGWRAMDQAATLRGTVTVYSLAL